MEQLTYPFAAPGGTDSGLLGSALEVVAVSPVRFVRLGRALGLGLRTAVAAALRPARVAFALIDDRSRAGLQECGPCVVPHVL